jgi:hypothetical protein
VPAVGGQAPLDAYSAGFSSFMPPSPGDIGWVAFEGGDPARPVWIGATKPVEDVRGDLIDYKIVIAPQSTITGTPVSLAGLSVTVPGEVGRLYLVTLSVPVSSTVAGDLGRLDICNVGGTILDNAQFRCETSQTRQEFSTHLTADGSTTWHSTLVRSAGTGSLSAGMSANTRGMMRVEDIGLA